ncbi:MAG: MarR family transcriptional regulator [Dehalococcoidia bacterium]|nr:MarR family transcriptional regulator [Dehalococcoidia bacterium]MCL2149974.1 MarR family transcriptional regulator [Dehalococcoidia bacterium]
MVDYEELAATLLATMQAVHKARHQKDIGERLQGEALVLQYINQCCQSTIIPQKISSDIGVSSARVAVVLNDLESKGLITREIDRNDRRKVVVKITAKGQGIAEECGQEILHKTVALLRSLGERDAIEYVRIMGRLAEEMSKIDI